MAVIYTKSGTIEIVPTNKKTRQGSSKNTKYARRGVTLHNENVIGGKEEDERRTNEQASRVSTRNNVSGAWHKGSDYEPKSRCISRCSKGTSLS